MTNMDYIHQFYSFKTDLIFFSVLCHLLNASFYQLRHKTLGLNSILSMFRSNTTPKVVFNFNFNLKVNTHLRVCAYTHYEWL